jgi:hypothetical protein
LIISPPYQDRRDNDVEEAQRNKELPAEVHKLVVAEARISPPDENLEPAEKENFNLKSGDPGGNDQP